MNDSEKIEIFGDAVKAAVTLSAPWRRIAVWILGALVITNLFWSVIVWKLVHSAYMDPVSVTQEQDLEGQTQNQAYSSGVTDDEWQGKAKQ